MSFRDDLNYGLAAFGIQIPASLPIDSWSARLTNAPSRNSLAIVAASALLFHHFERGHNPKVNDLTDAMLYCSTCLSVGYADIHPLTKAGKLLGTLLMTYGPALAAKALDGVPQRDPTQDEVLATLRHILAQLERQSLAPPAERSSDGEAVRLAVAEEHVDRPDA